MKQIKIRLSDEFYEDVATKAKLTERPISQYVRDLLQTFDHPILAFKQSKQGGFTEHGEHIEQSHEH